uniref:Acyl-CoA-binding protein homolog n=1 Tax=Caligus rogercresseyi TaxID=217165 RepID=C1BRA2_CALRO|nr:Acyl-CoA-binding protein homolog [Caligus rogercresseyi]
MSLSERFQAAADEVSLKMNQTLSQDEMKEVYALYKQATVGDVNVDRPGMMDLKGKAKWDSWSTKKGMTTDEAKGKYISLAKDLVAKHGLKS